MTIYIVVPLTPASGTLDAAIMRAIESERDRHKLESDRGWLIKFDGTSVELSNHIGITGTQIDTDEPTGSAIVIPVSDYYGRGSAHMWEWIKVRSKGE